MVLFSFRGLKGGQFAFRSISNCVVYTTLAMNMSSKSKSYEEAVYALNGLQSNAATLQKAHAERDANAYLNLVNTERHLKTLGIALEDLDSLNIIHIAGTKGKGSTCAFVESILRRHGYKTGFYSSPHLVSVNERIRINGVPVDKSLFTKYFWEVYSCIQCSLKNGEVMPPYFMFLTIMAFYVFLKEQIEAAVIEVGIGGLYDCTNVIKKPVVVAVTSLGIDHVHILGQTISEISVHKVGIFKLGVPAFTVSQHESAMKVLYNKAKEVNCSLHLAPPLEVYEEHFNLGVPGDVQSMNASLALQLVATWLNKQSSDCSFNNMVQNVNCLLNDQFLFIPMASTFPVNSKFREGLEMCVWPGRFQTIKKNGFTLYLDGAHTQQSMKHCTKWFQDASEKQKLALNSPVLRVLLFNCTGERKAENLLDPLSDVNFDLVVFSPNRKSVMKDSSSDQSNFMIDPEKEIRQCIINKEIWCHLMRSLNENESSMVTQLNSPVQLNESETTAYNENNILLFCCLSKAVDWLIHKKNIKHCSSCDRSNHFSSLLKEAPHIQILITGSLHLVGGVLALIDSDSC